MDTFKEAKDLAKYKWITSGKVKLNLNDAYDEGANWAYEWLHGNPTAYPTLRTYMEKTEADLINSEHVRGILSDALDEERAKNKALLEPKDI